jgi:hypothetical protein
LIANAARIVEGRHVALLLANIGPNLINLDSAAAKLAHLLVHELRATVANLDQQAADRIAMRPRHPLGAADRIAFDQAVDDLYRAGERDTVHWLAPFKNLYILSYTIAGLSMVLYTWIFEKRRTTFAPASITTISPRHSEFLSRPCGKLECPRISRRIDRLQMNGKGQLSGWPRNASHIIES